MAHRDPGHASVEGVEQGLVPLALRLVEVHVERRAHHEALELGLHDPVRAAGTGQAQVVATLRIHAARSCFIWSRARSTRSREEDTTNSVNRFRSVPGIRERMAPPSSPRSRPTPPGSSRRRGRAF
jgi:hypothetical protein